MGWLSEFLPAYRKRIGLPFLCNARPETITDEVTAMLKQAGCTRVSIGVESGHEWMRTHVLNRKCSNQTIVDAFRIVHKHGLRTLAYNMVGLPFETPQMAADTLKFNMKLRPNFGACFYFFPYPGCKLHQLCKEYHLLKENYDTVSSYLESPTVNETFACEKEIRRYLGSLQVFFYARMIFSNSKLRLPVVLENCLLRVLILLQKPILAIRNPNSKNVLVSGLCKAARKLVHLLRR